MNERERRLARLFRAESLKTQRELAEDTGIDAGTIGHYERGRDTPPPEHLELLAASARLTVAAGDEILDLADTLRQPRVRAGRGAEDLFAELGDEPRARRIWQRLLRLRLPDRPPAAAERGPAKS
jgi:transcriptional regulator with XRE-family HTH domain